MQAGRLAGSLRLVQSGNRVSVLLQVRDMTAEQ
jgi:hypothetical protein